MMNKKLEKTPTRGCRFLNESVLTILSSKVAFLLVCLLISSVAYGQGVVKRQQQPATGKGGGPKPPVILEPVDITIDGLHFKSDYFDPSEVRVSANREHEPSGQLIIPEYITINGKKRQVNTIDNVAFRGCEGLTSVFIPASIKVIKSNSFDGKNPEFIVDKNNTYFSSVDGVLYNKNGTKLIICPFNKENIIIPERTTEIESYAFSNCKLLKRVQLPKSLKKIGYEAFNGCTSLTDIDLPKTLIYIGNYAFWESGIKNITIPSTLKEINQYTLYGIKETINVDVNNPNYSSVNGVLYSKDKTILYLWPPQNSVGSHLVIPQSVKKVYDQAFWYTNFSSVTLSPHVDYWPGCFSFCKIDTLIIPAGTVKDKEYGPISKSTIKKVIIDESLEKNIKEIFDGSSVEIFEIVYSNGNRKKRIIDAYVDLGLPSGTLWAKFNVGATRPEEKGDYYAWGETLAKDNYSISNYKWFNNSRISDPIKYNIHGHWPIKTADDKRVLDFEDDAAYVNWGDKWCLPSWDQFNELKRDCHWTWTIVNGVKGYEVKGPNGNTIFLPAAGGIHGDEKIIKDMDIKGEYWTQSLSGSSSSRAYFLEFEETGEINVRDAYRDIGLSIRPVRKK